MNKIKEKYYDFAVSDFDGTLLKSSGEVSKKSIECIKNFIARGGVFSVCTGRMTGAIIHILKKLNLLGYVISYNGAEICDILTEEKIYKNHIDNQTAVKLLRYAEKNGFDLLVYPNDEVTVDHMNEQILHYSYACGRECNLISEKVSEYFNKNAFTTGKALFLTHGDKAVTEKIMREVPPIIGDNYYVINSNPYHVDVMKKGVSKGDTVKILAKLTGKSMQKLICFGDAMNDESMLKVAKVSAVTANGDDKLKVWCDLVIESCDDDGVRKAIEKYCI